MHFLCRSAFRADDSDMICFNSSPLFPLIDTLVGPGQFPLPALVARPTPFPQKETTNVERKMA